MDNLWGFIGGFFWFLVMLRPLLIYCLRISSHWDSFGGSIYSFLILSFFSCFCNNLSFYDCNANFIAWVRPLKTSLSFFYVFCNLYNIWLSNYSICSIYLYFRSISSCSSINLRYCSWCILRRTSSFLRSIFSFMCPSYSLISSLRSLLLHNSYCFMCYFKSMMTLLCSLTSNAPSLAYSNLELNLRSFCIFWSSLFYKTLTYLDFLCISCCLSICIWILCRSSACLLISRIYSAFLLVLSIFLRILASSDCKSVILFYKSFYSISYCDFYCLIAYLVFY